jgi:hypothetical protein
MDVTPRSTGVQCLLADGSKGVTEIIPADTPVPVQDTLTFMAADSDQQGAMITVSN